jgi:hypothetical protein
LDFHSTTYKNCPKYLLILAGVTWTGSFIPNKTDNYLS